MLSCGSVCIPIRLQFSVHCAQVMLTERDAVMAKNLRRDCRSGRIVAVVGMAHMDGLEEILRRP